MYKDIFMDILSYKLTETYESINTRRDIVLGPCEVRCVAYGISFTLPSGWIAASVLGEIYGIESIARNAGRIYITGQVASIADIIKSYAEPLDFEFVRLLPTTPPFVDRNQVSIHSSVQGVGPYTNAYATTAVTANNNAITLAALYEESSALLFRGAVSEIADSVTDIAT